MRARGATPSHKLADDGRRSGESVGADHLGARRVGPDRLAVRAVQWRRIADPESASVAVPGYLSRPGCQNITVATVATCRMPSRSYTRRAGRLKSFTYRLTVGVSRSAWSMTVPGGGAQPASA